MIKTESNLEEKYQIHPIGKVHSPHTSLAGMPIQPKGCPDVFGEIIIYDEYVDGLQDLGGFSHIYLLYFFHQAKRTQLRVVPFMDTQERGVFATRSPLRPNHIGLSVVRLHEIDGNRLTVSGLDILDGTPLLDIKPYIDKFDFVSQSSSGWMQADEEEIRQKRSDSRFL